MTRIGYHASHEQYPPSVLLRNVREAEAAGFQGAMCSDHFHPWSKDQGQSGFTWSWLGAALGATRIPFGTVNAPGYRYHPAIIAQACATLAEMFPGRFWLAVGSGEALNEHMTGEKWPRKEERNARLEECVAIMRRLWAGETVTHEGRVTVDRARLYTLPERPPLVFGAALSPVTAEWLGGWADGLITVSMPSPKLKEIVAAFHRGGGRGKPLAVQVQLSWAESEEAAREAARKQWRMSALASSLLATLETPEQFDEATSLVEAKHLEDAINISKDPEEHLKRLRDYERLGFEHIYLHNVGRNQQAFIETFGKRVLPAFLDE